MKVADKIKAYTTASMTEEDGKHIYHDNGSEPLPSASEILRVFSFGDYTMVNQEKLDEAAHIGYAVHAAIAASWENTTSYKINLRNIEKEFIIRGLGFSAVKVEAEKDLMVVDKMMSEDVRYQNCMKAYDSWLVANKNIIPLAVEKQFASQELGFGGTVDFICYRDNELCIKDWKSGNQIKFRDFVQLELYAMLLKKCCGLNAKRLVLVHLSKETGEYKERTCPDRKKSKAFALKVLRFWKQTEDFKKLVDGRRRLELV